MSKEAAKLKEESKKKPTSKTKKTVKAKKITHDDFVSSDFSLNPILTTNEEVVYEEDYNAKDFFIGFFKNKDEEENKGENNYGLLRAIVLQILNPEEEEVMPEEEGFWGISSEQYINEHTESDEEIKFMKYRVRIPELNFNLINPLSFEDTEENKTIIEKYTKEHPLVTANSTRFNDLGNDYEIKVGDLVWVQFTDTINFTGGSLISSINIPF